jgi:hypothetical protein
LPHGKKAAVRLGPAGRSRRHRGSVGPCRSELEPAGRILAALLPVPFNVAVMVLVVKSIRRLDEFQRRVHFEAVAVAFISTGLAVLLWGYLQKADIVGPVNVGLVWVPMTVFYCIGYLVAARHYR